MKTIYLDSDFVCHLVDDGTMQMVETTVFDDKPDEAIKSYRYVPEGKSWTRADGAVFNGLMVSTVKDYHSIMLDVAISYLDDEQAESVSVLFENWAAGVAYAVGDRRQYNGKLYRCVQAHTSQADWTPPAVPALWTECAKPGEGDSPDNPIPYNNNMELLEGKYYSQSGVVYRCFRSTGIPVYNNLADLVGIYVEVVE